MEPFGASTPPPDQPTTVEDPRVEDSSPNEPNAMHDELREPLQEERLGPGSPASSPQIPAAAFSAGLAGGAAVADVSAPPPAFPPEVVNPMVSNVSAHSTVLQRIKMFVLALTLLPLRILFLIFTVLLGWLFAKIAMCCVSDHDLETLPLHEGPFKRMTYAMARFCLFLMGYHWIHTKDKQYAKMPDGSTKRANIVVVNHSTVADGFLLYYLHGLMSIGVKAIADAPIIGTFAAVGQAMSLDRDNAECRKKIGDEMHRRVTWSEADEAEHGKWQPLVVFVEGTCTNQKALIQFRHGAFAPGVPVQPLCVRYPWSYCDQSWCGISSALWVKLRLLCQFHNSLSIEYLPVYVPSEEEKQNPKLYAENVQKKMAEALKVPVTDHTFEDMSLQAAAKRLRLPWRKIHAEMGFFRKHGSTSERAKKILRLFAEANTSKSGELCANEVLSMMKLQDFADFGPAIVSVWNNRHVPNIVSFRHFYFVTGLRKVRVLGCEPKEKEGNDAHPTARAFYYDIASDEDKEVAHEQIWQAALKSQDKDCGAGDTSGTDEVKLPRQNFVSVMLRGLKDQSELVEKQVETWWGKAWDEQGRGFITASQFKKKLVSYPYLAELLLMSLEL